ncbi:TPA: indole-3-glycerol phosphate synthase TrpC [Candidatus Poribacteria bacterium]|jgi:indole-3-glycerol phosphate synthase|nr:indole-3-glycerol phosphate synthase TrpC [Candidatus Poribacteria bacterium]HIB91412.1 indole-3-glycerol phosphate synthase TrpC [Candidatus Poribacteria bacterium]HIC00189.1 indole-3-glycerol phosphate synthase TrpC [Candidatus Poribacteria bacterium]HIC18770.1 indole-3-glycerol phosphate synthase TrpC [Candidatus Poribacteria bacterium]HIM09197.1 indole-3-glycerol phosphate synthase TrpC [Candidatus Poribacteria bacterium]
MLFVLWKGRGLILDKIVKHKMEELEHARRHVPLQELKAQVDHLAPTRDFRSAISTPDQINLIAEIKKKSPSKGIIRQDFDYIRIAKIYSEHGASAISVLTDSRFFAGQLNYLSEIHAMVALPLLRKDFTIDPYQVYEARAAGADAILLIVAILSFNQVREFMKIAESLDLACLVEVHTTEELDIALQADAEIIGINNRNLKVFKTDLSTTFRLTQQIPQGKIVISESGINSRDDVIKLRQAGVNAILVGESLMRSPDIGLKVNELLEP